VSEAPQPGPAGPLAGLRALELGSFIAASFAARLFAEFGGEVIKVERFRGGDELRQWRLMHGTTSLLWRTQARNKKSVTVDLQTDEGRDLVLDLVRHTDVVFENFSPGVLERLGLGFDQLKQVNPRVVLVRISGYGQSGPNADRPGFGSVAEAFGGMRYVTGYPDLPPVRMSVSIGDALAGLFGLLGALMALLDARRTEDEGGTPQGQEIDVALYEAVFATLESLVPDYEGYGFVRERTGNALPGVAASNTYRCADDAWVVVGANADRPFHRLMRAIGRPDLAEDPDLSHNPGRIRRREEIDALVAAWASARPMAEAMQALVEAGVPAGPVYSAEDIAADPHYRARGMLEPHTVDLGDGDGPRTISFPGVVPKMSSTPGGVRWLGPELGEHTDEVLGGLLGLDEARRRELREQCVI